MQGVRPGDGDRLPWLEPYRESRAPGRPLPRRGYRKPLAAGVALGLLLAVGAGGYWLGQRGDERPVPRPSATVVVPPPLAAPAEVAAVQPAPAPPVTEQPKPATTAEADKPRPVRKLAKRKPPPRKKIRSAGIERRRLDAVSAAQRRRASTRPTRPGHPAWRLQHAGAGALRLQRPHRPLSDAGDHAQGRRAGRHQAGWPRSLCLAPRHHVAPTLEDGLPQLARQRRPLPGDRLMKGQE